jgi:hypothetical protein
MENNIKEFKKIIKQIEKTKINRIEYLEHSLIPGLGLNDENLNEQPHELSNYFGGGLGLKIWQYPNQFSKYLALLSQFKGSINSYLEIGCRNGGTFALTCEYLSPLKNAVAVDIIDESETVKEYRKQTEFVSYKKINSQSQEFLEFINQNFFDLIFIDGDHSYSGVKNDAEITRNKCNIQVFHDISSDVCPGVYSYWKEIKSSYKNLYNFYEFIDQYDSVKGNFLGIGVAIRKNWIKNN